MKNLTAIIIAHRLTTIKADYILVIKNDKILEQGKPTDLHQKKRNLYRACKFANYQSVSTTNIE